MMKLFKKFLFLSIITFGLYAISPVPADGQVNIITNKEHADFAANQNLQQTIVYSADPQDPESIVEVCQKAEICVIRGHTNWTYDGNNAIAGQASAIAQKWADTLTQAANQLAGKTIYFEPWNEPMRRDLECNNLSIDECASRLAEYIHLLKAGINHPGVVITSPAIDMHHPETASFFNAWGPGFANSFNVYSIHIYAPDIACPSGERYFKNQLNNYGVDVGGKQFIITESGALDQGNYGNPIYDQMPLCEFYCHQCDGGTIAGNWTNDGQILGYALFSFGPEGISWNLWAADCVKNALQNICACETCPGPTKKGTAKLIDDLWNRDGRQPSEEEALFGIGAYGGASSVNNDESFLQRLLNSFQDFFKISQGTYAPTHSEGEYPGDDPYRSYYQQNQIITLPGTVAEVCLEGRDIKHNLKFFPDQHDPDQVVAGLLNLTGQNHRVAQSLQAYLNIHHWASGSVFSDQQEFINAADPEGMEELVRRGLNLQAGHQTKAIPGELQEEIINREMTETLGSAIGIPQEKEDISVFDQPIVLMGQGGVLKEDEEHTRELPDGRKVLEPGNYEVKGSIFACCNPSHFDDLPYTYEQACSNVANDWICAGGEPTVPGDIIYGPYARGKFLADYFTGGGDLATYYETCYESSKDADERPDQVFNDFFINMSPEQRYRAFPVTGEEDRYTVKKSEDEYWACQISKIYLPQGLSALNACGKMMENELPGEIFENITKTESDKMEFSCDMGNLPYTDGPPTNIDAARSDSVFGRLLERLLGFSSRREVDNCEVEYETYTETQIVIDPETGEETEQQVEKQMANYCERDYEIKSKSTLIIPFYQKFEQCAKFLYGYLDGETTEQLHASIKEKTGREDTDPYNLFQIGQGNDSGVYSGGAESEDQRQHYQTEPGEFKVESYLGGDDFKFPGSVDIPQKAGEKRFYPGEYHGQLGI